MPFMGKKDVPFMGKEDSKDSVDKAKDEQSKKDSKAVADAAPYQSTAKEQSKSKSKDSKSTSKSESKAPEELKGEELDKAAKRADVEGRSQMTAEEKRRAIAGKSGSSSQHTRQTAVDPNRSEEKERERAKVAEDRKKDNPVTPGYRDRRSIVDDAPSRSETRPLSVADQAKVDEGKSKSKKDEPPEAKTVDTVDIELGDAHVVLVVDKARFRLEPAQVAYLTKGLVHANNDLHVPSDA